MGGMGDHGVVKMETTVLEQQLKKEKSFELGSSERITGMVGGENGQVSIGLTRQGPISPGRKY